MRWTDTGTDDPRVKVRAKKGSRPRTKSRPDFSGAPRGFVVSVDRGRYGVILPDGILINCVKARELGPGAIVVGDQVGVTGDLSGLKDTLARIVTVDPRKSELRRTSEDDGNGKEHVIVANAEVMCIVTAASNPTPRRGFIDRTLVAAFAGGLKPLLVITKTDLQLAEDLANAYSPASVEIFFTKFAPGSSSLSSSANISPNSQPEIEGLQTLKERLQGKVTVMVGHSGVGKSTLTNAIIPGLFRETGHVNKVTGRGRHTSSSALAAQLPGGGFVVDTPGVRSFGIAHVTPDQLINAFSDISQISAYCPRGCQHTLDSPDCALDDPEIVHKVLGITPLHNYQARVESFRRLLLSRISAPEAWETNRN